MPKVADKDNPTLSVRIGLDRKRKILKGAEKDQIPLSIYINKMIDTWFEVIEKNA